MKFGSKATASLANEIHDGLHHMEDDQLGKPAMDHVFIDQLVARLGHMAQTNWNKAYDQVREYQYQDNPPSTQTEPGVGPSQKGNQLVTLRVPPKSNNQLIVVSAVAVYDPSMTLLWLALGDLSFPFVPEAKGFTHFPLLYTKLTTGSDRLLQVVTGSSPARLGLFINSIDTMQDGRS